MRPFQEVAHGGDSGSKLVHITFDRSTVHDIIRLPLKTAKVDAAHSDLVEIQLKRLSGLSTCTQIVCFIEYYDASADVNPEILPRRRFHHIVVRHEHDVCKLYTVALLVIGAETLCLAQRSEVFYVKWPPGDILGPTALTNIVDDPSLI